MGNERPLVSAIIPCFNAARFLPEAIASIRAQRYEPLEIIVADDGSTDGTPQVVAGLGSDIRYFRKANGGAATALNLGLREARGEFIAPLDADDQWPENKLTLQAGRLLADGGIDIVTGHVQYVQLAGAAACPGNFEGPDRPVANCNLGAGLCRRRAFDIVGSFDEGFRSGYDQDWFVRAREAGLRIVVLAEVTLLYRLHESNMTRKATAEDFEFMPIVRKSLLRRRQRSGTAAELPAWSSFLEKRRTDD